ncbi:MAG: OmpA family protein [Verrucomicrobia bacterium]|nr:OmpA family protein [Verrucomicrobiota bacterium]
MNPDPNAQRREILQAETVYFDVDSSIVKSGEQSKLQRVADYLAANPTHDVLIEGHCDERGTEGYNQSLGERRALSTREVLATIGAPADRIFTTSYGESHPAAQGSGEAVWKQNRRAEFVVVLPAQ